MKTLLGGAAILGVTLSFCTAQAADLVVRLDARSIVRGRVHTELTLAAHSGPLTLVFPKWIPGEHGPTGPLETLVGLEIRANGQALHWLRDSRDMYAISLTVPSGVTQLDIALDTGLPTDGGQFTGGPSSSAQLAVISWNQFVLLPKGRDAKTISTEAFVLAPEHWHLACALPLNQESDGSVRLEDTSLAGLIDSPLQMGRFWKYIDVEGSAPAPSLKHGISFIADSESALAVPDDFATAYARLVAQAGRLFGTRMYRRYVWLVTLSDHVGNFGLEHQESSDDRVGENALSDPSARADLEGILAHEYVHSWNGKYRRPNGLLSPDFDQPMDGSLLWVYEGMTQYWGAVLRARAGLMSGDEYREMLASFAGFFDIETGSRWRSLADTAIAAQSLLGAPLTWSTSRRRTDFYNASDFLWLDVDTQLRSRSGGRASLDDYVQRFYGGPAGAPALSPYVESDIYTSLGKIEVADWRALIHRHLDVLGPEPVLQALARSGWRLTYSDQKNTYLEARQKLKRTIDREWSLGLILNDQNTVIETVEGGPAARAGVGPNMKLLAVDGRKYSPEVLDAAVSAAHISKRPIELLVANGDTFETVSVAYFDGPRWPHLVRMEDRADLLSKILEPREH